MTGSLTSILSFLKNGKSLNILRSAIQDCHLAFNGFFPIKKKNSTTLNHFRLIFTFQRMYYSTLPSKHLEMSTEDDEPVDEFELDIQLTFM